MTRSEQDVELSLRVIAIAGALIAAGIPSDEVTYQALIETAGDLRDVAQTMDHVGWPVHTYAGVSEEAKQKVYAQVPRTHRDPDEGDYEPGVRGPGRTSLDWDN